MMNIQGQDYVINFAGAGEANAVITVKVDNLTSGRSVTLNGRDVLHLSGAAKIPTLGCNNGSMKIVPNPMTDHSILTFIAPENGSAEIRILDLSGGIVCQTSSRLNSGQNSFRISGISKGIYLVKITGKNYFYSSKLISNLPLKCDATIEYVSYVGDNSGSQQKNESTMIELPYSYGDQLLFKGITGKYSTIIADIPTSSKTLTFTFTKCTDADNNNYSIVTLGEQTWMAENLNVGVRINGRVNQTDNNIIEKSCYNDDVNNCNTYGGMYNCHEMMEYSTMPGNQGICPKGWHILTDEEWTELTNYLSGEIVSGEKMKEVGISHWLSFNTKASNESGFSALPAGSHAWIESNNQLFYGLGEYGYWWSSTESKFSNFIGRFINRNVGGVYTINNSINDDALSVRCLRD